MEGCIVGSNVGRAEGMKVAVAAGLAVGDGVGATVGAPVGIALPPGTRTNPIYNGRQVAYGRAWQTTVLSQRCQDDPKPAQQSSLPKRGAYSNGFWILLRQFGPLIPTDHAIVVFIGVVKKLLCQSSALLL